MDMIIVWLILGLLGGALGMFAAYRSFPSEPIGWIIAIGAGLIGGWLGGWILGLLGLEATGWLGSLVIAFLGAWAILEIVKRTGSSASTGSRSSVDRSRRR